jgi:hypothetical protein
MAESANTTLTSEERRALADRLSDHADGITNVAAHQMEQDLRAAAAELKMVSDPPRLRATLPALRIELHAIAARCSDPATVAQLRIIMGES